MGKVPYTPTIQSLQTEWIDAFNARDLDRHVKLYTEDALLFGSVDELFQSHQGVRAYFGALGSEERVRDYPPPVVRHLADDVAVTAGYIDFADGDRIQPYRLTWIVVRRAGNWRIAQHHGSPQRPRST